MTHIENSEKKWQRIRKDFPLLAEELDHLTMTDEERILFRIIYAGLDCHDLPSVSPGRILEYVRASIDAGNELPYAKGIPKELFFDYILPPRVNNEFLDGSRRWLYGQLRNRVKEKSMLDAALEVNFWCCERATYMSTDDRTIAPFGMCNRTRGRCGEESTLLVCALRAVGIPARQVYVPFWSHCDDNHAWVEFWAEGSWHYMGACEPEPVPDRGWFDSAVSRAMMVRSRVPDFASESGYRVVNCTARYGDTVVLKVKVQKANHPVSGVQVNFQIINESRLVTLHTVNSDENGSAGYEFGIGSIIVSAYFDGRLIEKCMDLSCEREAVLCWEEGFDPLTQEWTQQWELVPPEEKIPPYSHVDERHRARLRNCDEIRKTHEKIPEEIVKFRELEGYLPEDKELLLSVLEEKDFYDVSCDTLEDYLKGALPWKDQYPAQIWKNEILAPRVEHEMLQPVRTDLQKYFHHHSFYSLNDVLDWMGKNLRKMPEYDLTDRRGNAFGYVRHGVCPESEWDILAVQICRAVGIPAALGSKENGKVRLNLSCAGELRAGENCSLSLWSDCAYRKADLRTEIPTGSYTLITSRRQIDGTISAVVKRFVLRSDREVGTVFPSDRTRSKLKSIPLASPTTKASVLIFLEPGSEPTEHLLLELLELKDAYNQGEWPIRLGLCNENRSRTLQSILTSTIGCILEKAEHFERYQIQTAMGVGDGRLPLAVVLDRNGNGVYACANYNIRTAHRMLQILRTLS